MKEFPVHKPPATLVRFLGIHGLSVLINGKLKITPPSDFNDPFEFAPGIDPALGTKPPTLAERKQHFLSELGLPRAVYFSRWGNGNEAQYRDWVNSAGSRTDLLPNHVSCMRESMTSAISAAYGIACFSAFSPSYLETSCVIRHWACYGDQHRGLALEFDGTHTVLGALAAAKLLFPVRYNRGDW